MSLTTKPISTRGLKQTAGVWLPNKNRKIIQFGDSFKLQTDNPIQKPLPSFELLELQWFLQRIQGMAGAVDIAWEAWEAWLYRDLDSNSDGEVGVDDVVDVDVDVEMDDDVEDFSLFS